MVTKFCTPPPGFYTGKILFANASKIITNWFLTLRSDIFKIICNLPKLARDAIWYICSCTNLCTYVKERKTSWKFQRLFYTWNYKHRFSTDLAFLNEGTGWVGLERNVILIQTVGRFDMWVTPYTSILTLAKLKYFMSKDVSTKTL